MTTRLALITILLLAISQSLEARSRRMFKKRKIRSFGKYIQEQEKKPASFGAYLRNQREEDAARQRLNRFEETHQRLFKRGERSFGMSLHKALENKAEFKPLVAKGYKNARHRRFRSYSHRHTKKRAEK